MYKARNINGVLWFSHWGGSAVLTRALEILHHEKHTTLDKHSIYLYRPTSDSSRALALAKDLGMKLAEGGKRTGLTARELRGNHLSSRLSRKELSGISAFGISAAGTGVGIAGLLGASPVLGGVMTVVGALSFVTSTAIAAKKKLSGKKRR